MLFRSLARLVSGLILATWWRFAAAQPRAQAELDRLAGRPLAGPVQQLPLPLFAPAEPDRRPWPAKFSLLTWGQRAIQATDRRHTTPPLDWTLAVEDMFLPWPQRCQLAAQAGT